MLRPDPDPDDLIYKGALCYRRSPFFAQLRLHNLRVDWVAPSRVFEKGKTIIASLFSVLGNYDDLHHD